VTSKEPKAIVEILREFNINMLGMFFHMLFTGERILIHDKIIKPQGRAKLLYAFHEQGFLTSEQELIIPELEELLLKE